MKGKKRWLSILACVGVVCSLLLGSAAAAGKISMTIDGKKIQFTDAYPFVNEVNRTQVPLRIIAEEMGYGVIWDQESQSAYIFKILDGGKGVKCLNFLINSKEVYVLEAVGSGFSLEDDLAALESKILQTKDMKLVTMDTEAVVVEGRTYIPVHYVATLMDRTVTWDQQSQTVAIS